MPPARAVAVAVEVEVDGWWMVDDGWARMPGRLRLIDRIPFEADKPTPVDVSSVRRYYVST